MFLPETPGFGHCERCMYFRSGPPSVCQQCASQTLKPAGPYYCPVCGQAYQHDVSHCGNPLCNSPDRIFAFNRAIAMKTGPLDTAIKQHKYKQRWGWGVIFARVLLGQLDKDSTVNVADAIIPMPTYRRPDTPRKETDHAGWVIECAIQDDTAGYPFRLDPPLIVKSQETPAMASSPGIAGRQAIADQLYQVLEIPDPAAVRGKFIVVFDDVFTTGTSLNTVARRLVDAGARYVAGLTLARQPWQ